MRKKIVTVFLAVSVACMAFGCGDPSKEDKESITDTKKVEATTEETTVEETTKESGEETNKETSKTEANGSELTEDVVLKAITKYCYDANPNLATADKGSYYFSVFETTEDEIVIVFRSYTGALIYYHVAIATGDVYSMEYVPVIMDEPQPGEEKFNVNDYIG